MAPVHASVSLESDWDILEQAALRRERDLLSAVLDTAGALVVLLDREGRIVRFNRACETTTGYSSEEVIGHVLWDFLIIPEEVEPVRAVVEQLRAGEFPNEYENYWLTRDGQRRLIAWSNTALLDTNGAVEYVIGTGIDITERRQTEAQRDAMLEELRQAHAELELRVATRTAELQTANRILEEAVAERSRAEEALQESEGQLRSLMETAESYAIFRLAVDLTHPYGLRIVLASPSLKKLLGVSELTDVSMWIANIHPDDLERVLKANTRSIETGTLFDEQYRVFKPERGEWDWVHNRSLPVFDDAGRLTHYNGLMVDITKQKRAEEEIRRQNEFLAALHETALGIFSRLNVDELLEAMMERALHLIGATYGFVYVVRDEEDEVEVRVGTGPYRAYVGRRMKRGEGLAGRIYQSGQPLAVENYQSWPDRSPQFEGVPFGPAIGVPLMSGTEVVGVLGLARSTSEPAFRQDETDLIRRFGHLASIALDNARLFSSAQEQLGELQQAQWALQQRLASEGLAARISTEFMNLGPAEIDTGIQHALEAIGQVAGVDRSYVFQFSGDGTLLDNTHEWCAEGIQPYITSLKGLPRVVFPWFVGRLEQLEVVAVPNVADMPPEAGSERAECEREGIQSIILVPLTYRGTLAGFLGFDSVRRQRAWGEDTIALLKIAAGIITNALEHKRAQAIQAGQRQFLELLATGRGFSETLHTLVRLIEDQWPGMLGLILLLDEDGKHLHIGASVSLPQDYVQSIEGLEIGPMVGSCGTACYRRERVIVEDTATDPRWDGLRELALRYNLRACWSEPVFSPDGQVVGTFAMYYRQPRAPTEAELGAIEMGAHLVGVAIEHRRAEKALRESEEKFRGIVEYANIGIAIVQDARFRFMNPYYASMLGYTVEEMLGTDFMRYCTPDERERIIDLNTRRTRGEPVPTRYETAIVHKSGEQVNVEVGAGLIPYGGQQATFVSLRDITRRKQAQQALEEAYQTLEQRVEDRTRELSTLLEVSKNLVSRLELEPLLGSILDELRGVIDYEGCIVFGLEGEELVPLAHRGPTPQDKAMSLRFRVDDPLDRLVLAGREPVLVSDTHGEGPTAQAYRASLIDLQEDRYTHIRSWLGVPLMVKGAVIGELALDHSHPEFFTPAHASFAMAFANQAAVAIENARLYEAEQERTSELAALNSIAAVVSRSLDLKEVMSSALDRTLSVVGLGIGVVYRLEGEPEAVASRPALRLMAQRGITEELARVIDPLPLYGTFVERAALVRQPVVWAVADYPQLALQQYMDGAGVQTGVSVPLVSKDRMVGAMILGAPGPRAFSPDELSLLSAIGQQIGVAVENARLYEAEQGRREESERRQQVAEGLREILTILNSRQSLDDMLSLIAGQACRVLGSDAAALLRLDTATGLLGIQATCRLDPEYAAQISMPTGVGTAGRAIVERRPIVIEDITEAADYLEAGGTDRPELVPDLLRRLVNRYAALFSVPIIVKDDAYGALTFYYYEPRSFSEEEFRLALSVADQTALALENARLYEAAQSRREEAERRRQVAEGMREILAVLNSRQSLPETLDFIAMQTCRLLDGDAAAILRLEEDTLCIQTAFGLDADYIPGTAMPFGLGSAGRALTTHQPAIVTDLAEAARSAPSWLAELESQKSLLESLVAGFQAALSVPLTVQGQDYGTITVYYRNPRDFSDEDLRLAMGVANQAALAVESARLREQAEQSAALEERGRLARELHDSVTQSLYSVTMYTEAAARLMPAGHSAAAEHLRDARDTAQEALREMRLLIYQLRPPALEKGGLEVALQVRLDAVERRGGIQAELVVEGENRLPLAVQAELHQVAQEALNNALKHAHARQVQVRLYFGDASTYLQVRDDGVGFEPATVEAGGGLGLRSMKERAQRLGGRLGITSAPGQGTQVIVEVPTGGGE